MISFCRLTFDIACQTFFWQLCPKAQKTIDFSITKEMGDVVTYIAKNKD
jgi:hypothetical protein